jgi:hypothetical protein
MFKEGKFDVIFHGNREYGAHYLSQFEIVMDEDPNNKGGGVG